MFQRGSATIAVGLLLVLAGCGGIVSEDTVPGADARNDTTTVRTGISDEALSDAGFPAGFSQSAIDVSVAREATLGYLRTEPVSGTALERFRPGAYADYQYDANSARVRFRQDVHNGYSDVTRQDVYVASGVRYSRTGRNDQVSFGATNGSVDGTRSRAADSMWAVLSRILTIGELRAVEITDRDGDPHVRYAVTDVIARNASDVRGYLIVDTRGVVREAQLQYRQGGEPKRFQYSVSERSVDVTPPAWLGAAHTDGRLAGPGGAGGEERALPDRRVRVPPLRTADGRGVHAEGRALVRSGHRCLDPVETSA